MVQKCLNLGKARRRRIPIRAIREAIKTQVYTLDLDKLFDNLMASHQQYLEPIPQNILMYGIGLLLDHHNLSMISKKYKIPSDNPVTNLLHCNLNKLPDQVLQKVKEAMETDFEKNRVSKDDAQFQYDVKALYV
jgi:hypothetical protein